jgi:hypothetical protein
VPNHSHVLLHYYLCWHPAAPLGPNLLRGSPLTVNRATRLSSPKFTHHVHATRACFFNCSRVGRRRAEDAAGAAAVAAHGFAFTVSCASVHKEVRDSARSSGSVLAPAQPYAATESAGRRLSASRAFYQKTLPNEQAFEHSPHLRHGIVGQPAALWLVNNRRRIHARE